jgi:hypothetical protein
MIGEDQTGFSFDFPISDQVLTELKAGSLLTATYNGETRDFPAAPSAFRAEFADKCAGLVPPSLRSK